jgi:rhodanese-related sulfurtransferase
MRFSPLRPVLRVITFATSNISQSLPVAFCHGRDGEALMSLATITPDEAAALLREGGAILVDVREADERAYAHVPGSAHLPLSRLAEAELAVQAGKPVLFYCQSGARTAQNAGALAARAGEAEAFIVEGGLAAWQRAGLPVTANRRAPLPLMRQVQIVGAGLVMAGITGLCPMANALALMPWNRRAT